MPMNPSSTASVAAAEAATTAAGVLATSSTAGGRVGGLSPQRRHGFPMKRAGGAPGMKAPPFGRPSTASAATIVPGAQQNRIRRTPTSGGARGLYGEDSSEFWGGGGSGDHNRCGNNAGGLLGYFGGARGNSPTGNALTEPSLGFDGWEAHGSEGFFSGGGGGGGGQQDERQQPRIGNFVLDLDGSRGYACGGGGLADEAGGGEIVTPFQRWKNDRGITSPGVAEVFAGRGCGS